MKTNCPECGSDMVIVGTNLVIPEKSVYQTIFGCTGCPTKMETSRVLSVTEVAPFNPAQEEQVDEAQKSLVQF